MNTAIAERKKLYREIYRLDEESLQKAMSYIAFLRYMEAMEDREDIADIEARKNEPTVPIAEVIKEYENKYGSLS